MRKSVEGEKHFLPHQKCKCLENKEMNKDNICEMKLYSWKADSAVLHFCKKCYTVGQHFWGYTSGLPFFGEV